ncbi:MAG: hypothetical protein DRN25_06460 [Thermoplasmata archaeon]|nr:MAG: hypothetical protein DRN25_06460 [Thermoplasmata archaeon]
MYRKIVTVILIFLLSVLFSATYPSTVKAQDQEIEEGAAVVATIDGEIPPIKPRTWTAINITVIDKNGFNWTYFSQEFLNVPILRWYGKLLVWVIWPKILFRSVADYFGYNTLSFYPEIIEGNPTGWKMKVIPPSVSPTTDGITHHITLYVWADKTAMDYSVTIGIKCIRYSYNGKSLGTSYIYVPVKLDKYNYVEMVVDQPRQSMPPWSTSYITATITNKGYYEDTLHFILEGEGGIKAEAKEQQLVIKPGESKKVTFVVTSPRKFFEYGKSYEVKVYATSVLNPNQTYLGSFVVMIEGFSSNPAIGGLYLFFTIIFVILVAASAKILTSIRTGRRSKLEMEEKKTKAEISKTEAVSKIEIKESRKQKEIKKTITRDEMMKRRLIKKIRREEEKQRRKLKL